GAAARNPSKRHALRPARQPDQPEECRGHDRAAPAGRAQACSRAGGFESQHRTRFRRSVRGARTAARGRARDRERDVLRQPQRAARGAHDATSDARGASVARVRRGRRALELRRERRAVARPGRRLRGAHFERREARRSAGAASHQGRALHQSQGGEGARRRYSAGPARPRRRGVRMRRRDFISILGAAAAWPFGARAQQKAVPLVGFVNSAAAAAYAPQVAAFRQGLRDAGYREGENVAVEYFWAEGKYDRLPSIMEDLVRRQVNVIAAGGTPSVLSAKNATSIIPIVFSTVVDPVEIGLVATLARPGGNRTGVTNLGLELGAKRVELLHEFVPTATT